MMRLTQHRGRIGSARATADHIDRQGKLKALQEKSPGKTKHIKQELSDLNKYYAVGLGQWQGTRSDGKTLLEAEIDFYAKYAAGQIKRVNEAAKRRGHLEDSTTAAKLHSAKKTRPEEVITQIGAIKDITDANELAEDLESIEIEFLKWHSERFPNVVILDYGIHLDEGIPHVHQRQTYVYHAEDGHLEIGQEKALEEMGYQLPNPDKPRGRYNNRKITYTAECREKLKEITREYGYEIIEEPAERSKTHIDKEILTAEKALNRAREQQEAWNEFEIAWNEAEEEVERERSYKRQVER